MHRRNAIRKISQITARSLALAGAASPLIAMADAYPERPVSLVVPFPPGGTTDVLARVVGEQLGKPGRLPSHKRRSPSSGRCRFR